MRCTDTEVRKLDVRICLRNMRAGLAASAQRLSPGLSGKLLASFPYVYPNSCFFFSNYIYPSCFFSKLHFTRMFFFSEHNLQNVFFPNVLFSELHLPKWFFPQITFLRMFFSSNRRHLTFLSNK